MMKIRKLFLKIKLSVLILLGEVYKILVDFHIIRAKSVDSKVNNPKLIVSLTSYGRRVDKVYYTIVSLLRQTLQPDMVILWLDSDNWNDSKLPESLIKLKGKGLTIKYCKDMKSYKKLIPALNEYPTSMVVTCDDDIYYRSNMLERLVNAYEKDPTKIYAHRAHKMTFGNDGELESYNNWQEEVSGKCGFDIFPTSGGGTLYTRKLLYKDICNEELFMKLTPKADDVWNFFMGLLNHTENVVLPYNGYIYLPLDVLYQRFHKNSNLASSNCGEHQNDVQIKAVMDYYKLDVKNIVR